MQLAPPPPEIFDSINVTPLTLGSSGGELLTIDKSGIGLSENILVTLDGSLSAICTNVTYVTDDRITCLSPQGSVGQHLVIANVALPAILALRDDGLTYAAHPRQLAISEMGAFINVNVGDLVVIVSGTGVQQGIYTVMQKMSSELLELDRTLNLGIDQSNAEFKILRTVVGSEEFAISNDATPTTLYAANNGAFQDVAVSDLVFLTSGDKRGSLYFSTVITKTSNSEIILAQNINDGTGSATNLTYQINALLPAMSSVVSHASSGGALNSEPKELTTLESNGFAAVNVGDLVLLKGGINFIPGVYTVSSLVNSEIIELDRTPILDSASHATNLWYEVVRPISAYTGNSFSNLEDRRTLSVASAATIASVKVGDRIIVKSGANTLTGSFYVIDKLSSTSLLLDRDLNDGVGNSTDVRFSIVLDKASSISRGSITGVIGSEDLLVAHNTNQFVDVEVGDTLTLVRAGESVENSYTVLSVLGPSMLKLSEKIGPLANVPLYIAKNIRTPRAKSTSNLTLVPSPFVSGVSPAIGATVGGNVLTITGHTFDSSVNVLVGGAACNSVVVNGANTSLTCTMADLSGSPHAVGVADIKVTSTNTNRFGIGKNLYTFVKKPMVYDINPIGGITAGGYSVTITGVQFDDSSTSAVSVKVGTATCAPVTAISDTSLTCTLQAGGVLGAATVEVTNLSSGDTGTLSGRFTFNNSPTISAVTTSHANNILRLKGGDLVTITGTNFIAPVAPGGNQTARPLVITIGGDTCTTPTFVSSTSLTCLSPVRQSNGSDTLTVTLPTAQVATRSIYYQAIPEITGFALDDIDPQDMVTPKGYASVSGGDTFQILGHDFVVGGTTVEFGKGATWIECTGVTVAMDNKSLQCTTPANATEEILDIRISVSGTYNNTQTFSDRIRYAARPNIVSISPTFGRPKGGEEITITGADFTAATLAYINNQSCTTTTFIDATELKCIVPVSTTEGSYDVKVVTENGTGESDTLASGYSYIAVPEFSAPTPTEGPLRGGTELTLTGHDLFSTQNIRIKQGATDVGACNVTTSDPARKWIKCTTPASANEGQFDIVITPASAVAVTGAGLFRYDAVPTISSISDGTIPNTSPLRGGDTITITGTDFLVGQTSVTIDGVPCTSPTVLSLTSLTCVTPQRTTEGAKAVVVSVSGLNATYTSSATPYSYTYDAEPLVTNVSPTTIKTDGGETITITGNDFGAFANSADITVDLLTSFVAPDDVRPCTSVTVTSMTTLTCVTSSAPDDNVNVDIRVRFLGSGQGYTGLGNNLINYDSDPAITSISPTEGTLSGGEVITIIGSGFTPTSTDIYIAKVDTPAVVDPSSPPPSSEWAPCTSYTFISSSEVTCVVPSHRGANSTPVNNEGQFLVGSRIGAVGKEWRVYNGYTYNATPTISTIPLNVGPLRGGQSITINGNEFLGDGLVNDVDIKVEIGGELCSISAISELQITCSTPVHTTEGARDVKVTVGDKNVTLLNGYTYDADPIITDVLDKIYNVNNGRLRGGNRVRITGHDFTQDSVVDVVGVGSCTIPATPIAGTDFDTLNKWVECTMPAHSLEEMRDVKVTVGNKNITKISAYGYDAVPAVTSINPTTGNMSGDTEIVITGHEFYSAPLMLITVDGQPCTNLSWLSMNVMSCKTPHSSTEGARTLVVTVKGIVDDPINGFADSEVSYPRPLDVSPPSIIEFTYIASPSISTVTPSSVPLRGGTVADGTSGLITITGKDFVIGNTQVTFNNDAIACTSVSVAADNKSLTCIPAAYPTEGLYDVKVVSNGKIAVKANAITYNASPLISSVTPSTGPLRGGTVAGGPTGTITISGADFLPSITSVTLGGGVCSLVNVIDSTTLTCKPAIKALEGNVDVVVTVGDQSKTLVNGYTYDAFPTVSSISPSIGTVSGNTTVTIVGTDFVNGVTSVSIGGAACSNVVVTSASSLYCDTPASATEGAKNVIVQVGLNVSDPLVGGFVYDALPNITGISPTSGKHDGGDVITITGTELFGSVQSDTTVTIGGVDCPVLTATLTTVTCTTGAGTPGLTSVVVTVSGNFDELPNAFTYKKALGTSASTSSECSSGYLSDGVCCNSPCDTGATCQTCGADSIGGVGYCDAVKAGADTDESCSQGVGSLTGCRANSCSGNQDGVDAHGAPKGSCGYQTTGDGGCPDCQTCVGATSEACAAYPLNTLDGACDGNTIACSATPGNYTTRTRNVCNGSGACEANDAAASDCNGTCGSSCSAGSCISVTDSAPIGTCDIASNNHLASSGDGVCVSGSCSPYGWGAKVTESPHFDHASIARIDSTRVLMTGYDNGFGSSKYGMARIGTISGTALTFGTNYTFNSNITYTTDVVVLNAASGSELAVVAYNDNGGTSDFKVKALTFDATSITGEGIAVVIEDQPFGQIQLAKISSTAFVVVYSSTTDSHFYGYARVGTLTGTTITLGAPITFASNVIAVPEVTALGTKVVIAFSDNSDANKGNAIVGDVDVVTRNITFGTKASFTIGASGYSGAFNMKSANSTDKIIVNYQEGMTATSPGYLRAATISGTTLTFGAAVEFAASVSYSYITPFSSDTLVVGYHDFSSKIPYFAKVTLSGTTITLGTARATSPISIADEVVLESISPNKFIFHSTQEAVIGEF